jgi:hypothetical protein
MSVTGPSSEIKVEKMKEPFAAVLIPPLETYASDFLSHTTSVSDGHDSFEDKAPAISDDLEESLSSERTAFPLDSSTTAASENGLDADFDLLFNADADMNFSAPDENANESDPDHCVRWNPLSASNSSKVATHFPQRRHHAGSIIDTAISTQA